MEPTKKPASKLFANPQVRLLGSLAIVIVIIIGGIVLWRHHLQSQQAATASAAAPRSPGITSTPGAAATSRQYQQDVESQNIKSEHSARTGKQLARGASVVPTLNQPGLIGNASEYDTATTSDGRPMCPIKVVTNLVANPTACSVVNLMAAHKAGVLATELRCQGCACPSLKAGGYTLINMKQSGFSAKALNTCGYSWRQLLAAGFSAADLRAAGASAADLLRAGFTPSELAAAGYSASVLSKAGVSAADLAKAGFSSDDLKKAGFTTAQLIAAKVMSPAQKPSPNCTPMAIKKAQEAGQSIVSLVQKGCTLADLRAAGVNIAQLKAAGFSAAQLKKAGFSAAKLKAAGFSSTDLRAAGYSAAQLKKAGFTAKELRGAGYNAKDLVQAGYNPSDLKQAGFSAASLKNAGLSSAQLRDAGFSASALKKAGLSAADLKKAGFSAGDLVDANVTSQQLAKAGYTKGNLLRAGLSPAEAGVAALPTGSSSGTCSVKELRKNRLLGVSAKTAASHGCSLAALKAAGYDAAQLLQAGFTPTQLHDAGVTSAQIKAAGVTLDQMKVAGYTAAPVSEVAGKSTSSSSSGIPSISQGDAATRLKDFQKTQEQKMIQQQAAARAEEIYGLMNSEAQSLIGGWAKPSTQGYIEAEQTKQANGATERALLASAAQANTKVLKAGSVYYAVINTSINTDEQSPVLATITDGPLKGGKLLGAFVRLNDKVALKFNKLNLPQYKTTLAFNAVAISPSTAHTVLSGHVNHHYLLRYSSMFASGFLGTISQALQTTGSSCGPSSIICISTQPPKTLSYRDQALIGLGGLGSKFATNIGSAQNTNPTVKIASGTGIGLLIMNDFTLPHSDIKAAVRAKSSYNRKHVNG